MTIYEQISYLKGLAEGLGLDENNKQDKLIKAIIDVLDEIAISIDELEDVSEELCQQIDAVDEDLANLEEDFYDDDCDCDCDCDSDCDCDCCDEDIYEVVCPGCNEEICIEESVLDEGSMICPNCGETLEFEFDDECECGCDCCDEE